ncbi:MAG: DUF4258 domain-containing protein [Nitrospirota bacterium]
MNRDQIANAVESGKIEWQRHALERMMERGISRDIVKNVLLSGEIIELYPDNKPYPSALFLGRYGEELYHVVIALNSQSGYCFIITAYKPDLEHFESDYKTRRKRED